jgi:hypothetical protein
MKTKPNYNYRQLVKEILAEYPESRTNNEQLYWLLCDRKLGVPFETRFLKAIKMIADGKLPKHETIFRLARQIKAAEKRAANLQQAKPKKVVESLPIADIRNKLTPVKNMITMLESSTCSYHQDKKVNGLIKKEMKQSKKSVDYLASGGKKNLKNKE